MTDCQCEPGLGAMIASLPNVPDPGPLRRAAAGLRALVFQVAVLAGYGIRFAPVSPGVAIGQKPGISGVGMNQRTSMLNRAEVLFGSRRNLGNHGEQSVGVGAVNAA